MFNMLVILAIGIIIGWNWPQPTWAKDTQDKIVNWVRSAFSK